MRTPRTFLISNKPLQQCVRSVQTGSSGSPSGWRSLLSLLWHPVQRMLTSSQRISRRVSASLGAASLALTATVKSTMLNNRQYLAFLFFCASPVGFCIHMPFDRKVKYEWMGFIENWFHYFNMVGPYLFVILVLTGVFFLIAPTQIKTFRVFRWTLHVQITRMLSVPVGITIAKIIWLSLVTSNEDFWAIPAYAYFTVGLIAGYAYYRTFEYFIWRKFHAFDALIASLEGLYKAPDMDLETRNNAAAPLWKDVREFHSKY